MPDLASDVAQGKPARGTGLLASLALGVVLPAFLISETPTPRDSAWILALAVSGGSALRYGLLISRGTTRLYELIVWLFVYAFLGLAPLVQLRTGVAPGTTPYVDTSLNGRTMWAVVVGCLALAVGMWLGTRTDARGPQGPSRRAVDDNRVAILSGTALLVTAYYLSQVGLGPVFSSRAERARAAELAWPEPTVALLVYSAMSMTLLVASVAGLMRIRRRVDGPRRAPLDTGHALTVLTTATLVLVVNPFSSPRYVVGTMYLALAAAAGAFDTPRRFRVAACAAAAGLLLVFPVADAFRYTSESSVDSTNLVESLQSPDFDVIRQLNNTLRYVEVNGATDGEQALGVVLFWVPRAIWPDKPSDTGILLAEFMHYPETNLSAPLWAEMYINGSWPLLITGMAAFGWAVRRWDRSPARHRAGGPAPYILPFYLLFVLRGSLLQAMAILAIILIASYAVTSPSPARSSRRGPPPPSTAGTRSPSGRPRSGPEGRPVRNATVAPTE